VLREGCSRGSQTSGIARARTHTHTYRDTHAVDNARLGYGGWICRDLSGAGKAGEAIPERVISGFQVFSASHARAYARSTAVNARSK